MRHRFLIFCLVLFLVAPQPSAANDVHHGDAVPSPGVALHGAVAEAQWTHMLQLPGWVLTSAPQDLAAGDASPVNGRSWTEANTVQLRSGVEASAGLSLSEGCTPAACPNRSGAKTDLRLSPGLRQKFEPALLKRLLAADEGEPVRGIAIMRDQMDVQEMDLSGMDLASRRKAVVQRLRSMADLSQQGVRSALERARLERRVMAYKPLWILNGIVVEGRREVFWELAARSDVSIILHDHVRHLPAGERPRRLTPRERAQLDDVQWNVRRVLADQVWQSLGLTGEGVVVASLDSGVDWQHPDLMTRYRGYTGKPFATHDGNWYCATDERYLYPGDGLGHGTHTVGTMVGQNGIGVAPGAQWIAAKVFNNQGVAYDSWIHDGFEWVLAPNGDPSLAPDVVNSSWGSKVSGDERFLPDVRALRAAGILPVFAAGNEGPERETVTSPASFRESFAVGATDDQDRVARFSGRGPSPWKEIKPEVCAPGVGIVSAIPGGAWGVSSGTSMAAPHVAGLVALMLQSDPALTVDQIEAILTGTALPLGDGRPNDDYGWGLVQAYAAVVEAGNYGRLAGRVTDDASGAPVAAAAVEAVSHSGEITVTATTGSLGAYNVGLGAGAYDVTFAAFAYDAHVEYGVEVVTATTTALNVALAALPAGVLRGTIREGGTGAPLRAAVYVPGSPATTMSSLEDGAYSLVLPQGTHAVRVECAAHRVATATVAIREGETVVHDFVLDPAPTILLVDSGAWYNGSQRQFYASALDGLGYLYDLHIVANVDITPTDVPTTSDLLPYDLVIWSAPQDAPGYIGATAAITNYLTSGGRLLLSGQDVAFWDDGGNGFFYAPYFRNYLKARFVSDNAASRALEGEGIFAGLAITIAGQGGADNQVYPDVVAVTDADYATLAWTYLEDGSGGQTVGPCLPYRAVLLAFGLEGIDDGAMRRQVLQRSIDWLMAPLRPAGIELIAGGLPHIGRAGEWITHAVRLRNTGEVSADTYSLALGGNAWPTWLSGPPSLTLGACQSATLQISVGVPARVGWHVFDTATLTSSSVLAPGLVATASLVSKTPAPVLLVDGARFYRLDGRYRDALDEAGIPYDYHRVKAGWPLAIPATDTLRMYPAVAWYTSYDWYRPLSDEEEARLLAYLDGGGRLFFSSQDYLYYSRDRPLAREYLGVFDYSEGLSATVAYGEAGHPIGWGLGPFTLTYPYQNWSDSLIPISDAAVALRNEHDLAAGITHSGSGWRTAFMAFPFETLEAGPAATVMARTVGWLSWLGTSTWAADRRVVAAGSQVTMTCVLRNDGWADVASAHVSATLPAELSLVDGSLSSEAAYDPSTRAVRWQGSIARDAALTITFRATVSDALPDGTYLSFPARIGYDDHAISFDRPYILRVNAPDLSLSALQVAPGASPPLRTLAYTLTVRNAGLRDATATVTATIPDHAEFVGPLDSDDIGWGQVLSKTLSWTGPVAVRGEVLLRYRLALDGAGDYWLRHEAWVSDQYGEKWPVEARTEVRAWKAYLPLLPHREVP